MHREEIMKRTAPSLGLALVVLVLAALPSTVTAQQGLSPAKAKALAGKLYLVFFEEEPLATYRGDLPGLEATSPQARGEAKLDAKSPASRAYLDHLDRQQARHIAAIEGRLARNIQVTFRYKAVSNGIATALSPTEAQKIRQLPGVTRVVRDRVELLDTDRGPSWIGAPDIWDGSATSGLPGTKGDGVIVGVIDSGVNMDHPSFADVGGDGHNHTNPFGPGTYVGWCDPGNPDHDPSYVCNDKLIGAWDYSDAWCAVNTDVCSETDGPEDNDGHGSHTASTAAGNVLNSPAISGVAPHANLITYDACVDDFEELGLCPFATTTAARDQAALDGVDVTNYSIGGGSDPWGDDSDAQFLNLVYAGVYPAASAGNSGPGPNTVGHLGPWMSTTAASTHDRETVENNLINMSGGTNPPANMDGASMTGGYGPASIVYAKDFDDGDPDPRNPSEQCLIPFPANTWTNGEIVLCDRGTIARVAKCANVAAGGAAGCVLANANAGQGDPVADPHVIPAIHVDDTDGTSLRNWLGTGAGHMATITAGSVVVDPAAADIMASFSSRGPNSSFDVLKPDLTGPGVNILAAVATDGVFPPPEFGTLSGTSMSSPHNAGAGALLTALYPDWSSSAIKSALMTTADTTVHVQAGVGLTDADPFDRGAGRLDLTKAAMVGLVFDETVENYWAANPDIGGDPGSLNLPSLQSNNCVVDCTWTRTVTSVASAPINWTVGFTIETPGLSVTANPNNFTLAPGATQEIEFTAIRGALPLDAYAFGQANFTEPGASPDLHIPIAIRPTSHNLPTLMEIDTIATSGGESLTGMKSDSAITDLDIQLDGLVKTAVTAVVLDEDPTNGDPYDDLGQIFFKTVAIPANTKLLIATTESDESPDVDLYVGTGNTPSAATEVCVSGSPTASESCEVVAPAAGTWWILVQNWTGSSNQPDLINLTDAALPDGGVGNFNVTGPSSVPAATPFDLDLFWNEPAMAPGDTWIGAFDVGTDSRAPGNVGSVAVVITVGDEMSIFADGFESGDAMSWSDTSP